MKNKVLLINPSYQPHWSRCEPTGLLYIASFLKSKGLEVKILDLNIEDMSTQDMLNYIADFKPSLVGISSITRQILEAYHLGNLIKKKFINIKLVYGGIHPTFLPKECFQKGSADYVVIGEGEETMYELIKNVNSNQSLKDVKGICFRSGKKIVRTKERDFLANLDSLPFPDYSIVPIERYNSNIHVKEYVGKTIHMITSRGCGGDCYYCCSPALYKHRIRFRSPENVVKEIEYVIKKYGIKNIHFHDDNFLINPKRVLKLCHLIKDKNLSFHWICLSRVDVIAQHPTVLPVMREAGCVGVEIGVETGDEYVLDRLNKKEIMEQIYLANKYLKQNDLYPMYLVMSYSLGENIDSSYKTARLYYELKTEKKIKNIPALQDTFEPDLAGHLARPSPGSVFYKIAPQKGIYFPKNWEHHIEEELNFLPNEFIYDIAVRNKILNQHQFFSFFKPYYNNLQLYINQNFYNSNPIMDRFFNSSIDSLLKFMFDVYKKINDEETVKEIAQAFTGNKKDNLIKAATAISMLSIFRLIKSKISR